MDVGISDSWGLGRRLGQSKQGVTDKSVGGAGTFDNLLRNIAKSPAGSEPGSMRYNKAGPSEAFAKAFSEMPIVAPVAEENQESPPKKSIVARPLCSLPTEKFIQLADHHAGSINREIEPLFLIQSTIKNITVRMCDIDQLGNARLSFTQSPSITIAATPSRPANVAHTADKPLLGKVNTKSQLPSAQLSQTAVQLTPFGSGVKISVRVGKLDASENEQLQSRISTVARQFGLPLAGLSIRTLRG